MWSIAGGLFSLVLGGIVLGAGAVAAAAPGELDPTFGAGGLVVTDLGGADSPGAVALQPDGKIVVAGTRVLGPVAESRFGVALVRYRSDGTLDAAFGAGGLVVTELGEGTIAFAAAVALQPDGKILVAGGAGLISGEFHGFMVARYHSDGALDPTFGRGGLVVTGFGQGHAAAAGLALQADGRIVVAGTVSNQVGLARYTASGALDPPSAPGAPRSRTSGPKPTGSPGRWRCSPTTRSWSRRGRCRRAPRPSWSPAIPPTASWTRRSARAAPSSPTSAMTPTRWPWA
jgi:uncharacterized delta-60 repeat protein